MADIKILKLFLQSLFLTLCFPFQGFGLETDTITSTLSVKDPDHIVSRNPVFKLGFFTPVNTNNRYLGIFYAFSEETVIWVANRDRPLRDSSGTVTISEDGNLVLKNGRNHTVWSTNATNVPMNTTAQIQETGNLVLRDISTGNVIWDSFSHPTNVWVPTMRITHNIKTGEKRVLSSWKSESDPGIGNFTSGIEVLQTFIWKNGRPHWRSGPFNGLGNIGVQSNNIPNVVGFTIGNESDTFYFTSPEMVFIMKVSLNSSGFLEDTVWNNQTKSWITPWLGPENECEYYGKCGPFGSCNVRDSPVCSCLKGFEPAYKDEWQSGNWTSGCVRKTQLQCDRSNNTRGNGDGFLRLPFMKGPDFPKLYPGRRVDECRNICLRNCSCIAYSHDLNLGCLFWSDTLIDILQFSGVGPDLYIRLASSELDDDKDNKLIIIIPVVAGFVCISICAFILWCWMAKRKGNSGAAGRNDRKVSESNQRFPSDSNAIVLKDEPEKVDIKEFPLFAFDTLSDATNQFNDGNMLGKGGFGSVYLGKLENGKQVAIKRLSEASAQGVKEFMNEVIVISKLQHRNLVRLIGCCVEREEKMLIYEYMPNKSLARCLFDLGHASQRVLDWEKRFNIIEGIARGLLYLHMDSVLRIIHRDLKPSNILLDGEWNPKISDFGMARIFGGNQDQANTARVVGTYGYMAPEYAMEGRFSEKSDVYSFGVLILEIVSGKKNTHYYNEEWSLSLLGFAWKMWNENNGMTFVDQMIATPTLRGEMMRCIHIALLCVQEYPKDRPTIQIVLSMLRSEIIDLPLPEQPVFAEKWNRSHVGINELSFTTLEGR